MLTGFLGSGKTTLLNRLVRTPRYAGAAVVINEFGSIGIDHHLVRGSADTVTVLEGGCICCLVRGALADTLRDLFMQALRRTVPPFRRLIIETSGLASPAPILFTLRHDRFLAERYVYEGTVAVADARQLAAAAALPDEMTQQVALADQVVVGKADLASAREVELARARVAAMNPTALVHMLGPDVALPAALLAAGAYRKEAGSVDAGAGWLRRFAPVGVGAAHDVAVCAYVFDEAPRRAAFLRGMAVVQEALGERLLRVKGVVGFAGEEGVCWGVHGVHRELYPLVGLGAWPDEDRRSRVVFIVRGVSGVGVEEVVRGGLG